MLQFLIKLIEKPHSEITFWKTKIGNKGNCNLINSHPKRGKNKP